MSYSSNYLIKITDTETTFTIGGSHAISSESVIGKTLTADVYPNAGKILYIFESRFGFLLLVILPALLFFFYELYRFVIEIKKPAEDKAEKVMENSSVASPASSVNPEPVVAPEVPVNPEPTVAPEVLVNPDPAKEPTPAVEQAKPENLDVK